MASFKCEPGKVLSDEEVTTMLGYDDAGVARPDEYGDVVFDNTSGTGAVYRCRTAEEDAEIKRLRSDEEKAAAARASAREAAYKEAGIDPATGGSTRPLAFNTAHDLPPADATRVANEGNKAAGDGDKAAGKDR